MVQGYYTIEEAAEILGMAADKLNQMAQRREIRAFADRGTWRVAGSTDVDWEATAIGPCEKDPLPHCVYIGDVGDNDAAHPSRTIYRVAEPDAKDSTFSGEVKAERITYTYSDQKHDVEAMYVASTAPQRGHRTMPSGQRILTMKSCAVSGSAK